MKFGEHVAYRPEKSWLKFGNDLLAGNDTAVFNVS